MQDRAEWLRRWGWWIAGAAALVALAVGLSLMDFETEADRLQAHVQTASTGPEGRTLCAQQMAEDFRAGRVTISAARDLAHEMLDANGGEPAELFAGAVLDCLALIEPDLPARGETTEFFWIRFGTLAGSAAASAANGGDMELACSLVLAGPRRWQNEAYWRRHPDHDALASMILHLCGESREALNRLRARADMEPQVQAAYDAIQRQMRARAPEAVESGG